MRLGALPLSPSQQPAFFDPDTIQKLLILTLSIGIKERFSSATEALPYGLHRFNGIGIVEQH